METKELRALELNIRQVIDNHALRMGIAPVESVLFKESENMVLQIKKRIYVKEDPIVFSKSFRFPANWKEALKERWLPKFLLKRFPVEYIEIEREVSFQEFLDFPLEKTLDNYIMHIREKQCKKRLLDDEPV